MRLINKTYSCTLSSGFYMQSMTIFSTLQFQQARTDAQVGWVRLMQMIRERTQLSNIVCLAKDFVYEVKEGGSLRLVSGVEGGNVVLQGFFTLCENIEEESISSVCP